MGTTGHIWVLLGPSLCRTLLGRPSADYFRALPGLRPSEGHYTRVRPKAGHHQALPGITGSIPVPALPCRPSAGHYHVLPGTTGSDPLPGTPWYNWSPIPPSGTTKSDPLPSTTRCYRILLGPTLCWALLGITSHFRALPGLTLCRALPGTTQSDPLPGTIRHYQV